MGKMRHMTATTGDTVVTWGDTEVEDATKMSEAAVEKRFNEIISRGATAVKVENVGTAQSKATQIKRFDKKAEEIVIFPDIVAG